MGTCGARPSHQLGSKNRWCLSELKPQAGFWLPAHGISHGAGPAWRFVFPTASRARQSWHQAGSDLGSPCLAECPALSAGCSGHPRPGRLRLLAGQRLNTWRSLCSLTPSWCSLRFTTGLSASPWSASACGTLKASWPSQVCKSRVRGCSLGERFIRAADP